MIGLIIFITFTISPLLVSEEVGEACGAEKRPCFVAVSVAACAWDETVGGTFLRGECAGGDGLVVADGQEGAGCGCDGSVDEGGEGGEHGFVGICGVVEIIEVWGA